MAEPLISCTACNNPISKKAANCPKCGHPNKRANELSIWQSIILCVFAFWASVSFFGADSEKTETKIATCVSRGVKYFKEIGSYPTLQSAPNIGKSAELEATERCNITTTAF